MLSLATGWLKLYPEIDFSEISFHLVEAGPRILPEVTTAPASGWSDLWCDGVGMSTSARQVVSADGGNIVLSDGEASSPD